MRYRKKLKINRESRALTQLQVAKLLGISKQHYSRIEKGYQVGSVKLWDKLENLFQIPQQQLRELQENNKQLHNNTQGE